MKKKTKIKTTKRRRKKGIVIRHKMDKTAVVEIERLKKHPYYHKIYKVHRRLNAHDPENAYKIGDHVLIEEMRPVSASKKWKVVEKL
jgi:small subunit ribosomal protein S17